jgi:aminocarboxymuconate-semialdehyde decarboxylase
VLTVDVHTHFVPRAVLADARRGTGFDGMTAERAGGREWLVHRQGFRYPVPPVFYDLDARLAAMDERGISHAVLSIAPQLFMYWVADELRRAVTELGMPGVPLIVHPYYVGPRPGLEEFYLTNLLGNPLATTVCAARLIFGGVLDELGALRLVLLHGGGYLPYQIGRLDHGHRVRPEARGCAQPPSRYLARFWFDTVTHAPAPLRFLAETVGADRVMFGTDFPFDMAAGPLHDQLDGTGLRGEDIAAIAGLGAARLFRLPV